MGESGFVIIDLKSSHEIILVCFKAPAVCFDAPNTTTPKIFSFACFVTKLMLGGVSLPPTQLLEVEAERNF